MLGLAPALATRHFSSVPIASTLVVCSWTRQRQHYLPSSHQTHTTHGHTDTFTGVCGCCWYQYSLIKTSYYCRIGFHLQHGQIWRNLQKRWSPHTIVLWQHLHADVGCFQPKDVNTENYCKTWHNEFHSIDYILLAAGFENTQWGNKEALSGTNKQACLYKLTKPLKVHMTFSQMSINYLLSLRSLTHTLFSPHFSVLLLMTSFKV